MKRSQRVDKSLVLFRSSFIAKSGESNGLFIIFHEEPRAGWTFFFGAPSLRQTFVNKRTSAEGPSALSSARSALNFPHRCVSDRSISLRNAALLWCKGRPRAQWPLIFFRFVIVLLFTPIGQTHFVHLPSSDVSLLAFRLSSQCHRRWMDPMTFFFLRDRRLLRCRPKRTFHQIHRFIMLTAAMPSGHRSDPIQITWPTLEQVSCNEMPFPWKFSPMAALVKKLSDEWKMCIQNVLRQDWSD